MFYLSLELKQQSEVDTQKIWRKEWKHTTMENDHITKEDSKRRKEYRGYKKPEKSYQNGNSLYHQ